MSHELPSFSTLTRGIQSIRVLCELERLFPWVVFSPQTHIVCRSCAGHDQRMTQKGPSAHLLRAQSLFVQLAAAFFFFKFLKIEIYFVHFYIFCPLHIFCPLLVALWGRVNPVLVIILD